MAIRWTSAARLAGIAVGAVAALALIASALEPPAPAAVPPDVGLDVTPADPPITRTGPKRELDPRRRVRETKADPRRRRPPRPDRHDEEQRTPKKFVEAPAPAPTPAAPVPVQVSAPPVPAPAPTPSPAPADPPAPSEFGFER